MNIYEKLSAIQADMKVPKNQRNNFGGYNYRSAEDILEMAKPVCRQHGAVLTLSDTIVPHGARYYVQAEAMLIDTEDPTQMITVYAWAREEEVKKGMDSAQITGATSSYARKYALNGLFNIDDTKDADSDEFKKETDEAKARKASAAKTSGKGSKAQKVAFTKNDLVEMVVSLCDKKRFRVAELCERTGVEKLEDMQEEQLSRWIDWLETR